MLALLAEVEAMAGVLGDLAGPPPQPRFDQDWFPRLDAALVYGIVRHRRPRRIIEVGSGHSSRFMARAVTDAGLVTTITCIDPAPRASLTGLSIEHVARPVEQIGERFAAGLGVGDLLFIDSSHKVSPAGDVDLLFNRVIPQLPAGILVHVHDIFLPDEYPAAWAWRRYNEQALTAELLATGKLVPLIASHWLLARCADRMAASPLITRLPLIDGAVESSLWAVTAG